MTIRSSWHLQIELQQRINQLKRRQQWLEIHGPTVRNATYLGIGIVLASVMALVGYLM